jgi:hypothetical protein
MNEKHALEPAFENIKRDFDTACLAARTGVLHELNQLLRRFRHYSSEADWVRLVLEGAGAFARQVALFSIADSTARLRGQLNLDLPDGLSFPLAQAAAFESVRLTGDSVIALRISSEITERLSTFTAGARAHLFPISNASRVAAVLFVCEGDEVDAQALELVAGLASCVLERQANATRDARVAFVAPPTPARKLPAWANLDESQRQVHLRAQRFARVAVAEMQLSRPEACRAGREQHDLYLFLKKEIDKARETYIKQFRTMSSMVDYLHVELVRIAAEGDELKLGADYPGSC